MTKLDPSSFDLTCISVASAAPGDNPRTGTVYSPVVFAAGAPVWFHPMPGGRHLMVRARRWSAATPGGVFSLSAGLVVAAWMVFVAAATGNYLSGACERVPLRSQGCPLRRRSSRLRPPRPRPTGRR